MWFCAFVTCVAFVSAYHVTSQLYKLSKRRIKRFLSPRKRKVLPHLVASDVSVLNLDDAIVGRTDPHTELLYRFDGLGRD